MQVSLADESILHVGPHGEQSGCHWMYIERDLCADAHY